MEIPSKGSGFEMFTLQSEVLFRHDVISFALLCLRSYTFCLTKNIVKLELFLNLVIQDLFYKAVN
jgi:hypothetical protein